MFSLEFIWINKKEHQNYLKTCLSFVEARANISVCNLQKKKL